MYILQSWLQDFLTNLSLEQDLSTIFEDLGFPVLEKITLDSINSAYEILSLIGVASPPDLAQTGLSYYLDEEGRTISSSEVLFLPAQVAVEKAELRALSWAELKPYDLLLESSPEEGLASFPQGRQGQGLNEYFGLKDTIYELAIEELSYLELARLLSISAGFSLYEPDYFQVKKSLELPQAHKNDLRSFLETSLDANIFLVLCQKDFALVPFWLKKRLICSNIKFTSLSDALSQYVYYELGQRILVAEVLLGETQEQYLVYYPQQKESAERKVLERLWQLYEQVTRCSATIIEEK